MSLFHLQILARPNLALSLGVLIHILTFIIPNNSINRTSESSTGYSFSSKMAMGLVPNVNLIWGIKMLMSAESKGSGLQWDNLFTRGEPDDPLTMGAVWLMFLFDCLLFSLIILYIDTVAPGKFGVARPWYFPVMGLCRNGTVTSEEVSPRRLDDDMFEVEPTGEAGVRVKHLRKEFPRWGQDPVKAVQDVSFAAFPGKITLPSTWPDTSASSPPSPIIILIIFDSVIIFSLLIRRNHSAAGSQWRRQDDHHVCAYRSLLFFTVSVSSILATASTISSQSSSRPQASFPRHPVMPW